MHRVSWTESIKILGKKKWNGFDRRKKRMQDFGLKISHILGPGSWAILKESTCMEEPTSKSREGEGDFPLLDFRRQGRETARSDVEVEREREREGPKRGRGRLGLLESHNHPFFFLPPHLFSSAIYFLFLLFLSLPTSVSKSDVYHLLREVVGSTCMIQRLQWSLLVFLQEIVHKPMIYIGGHVSLVSKQPMLQGIELNSGNILL